MLVRKSTHRRVIDHFAAELTEKQDEINDLLEERRALLERVSKLQARREVFKRWVDEHNTGIGRKALDLIRHSPLFQTTDPVAPRLTWADVESEYHRLEGEYKTAPPEA